MNQKIILGMVVFITFISFSFGQKMPQRNVPSVIVNSFQHDFPKAKDIEWKKKDTVYQVEFEIGWRDRDHKIWYNTSGKILRHKQEISKKDLPDKVSEKLSAEYKWYRIKDVKKIETPEEILYTLEAQSITEEWKLTLDEEGNILGRVAD